MWLDAFAASGNRTNSPEVIRLRRTKKEVIHVMLWGVALVAVNLDGKILMLTERESKPNIGKPAGSRSIPMETKEPGETDQSALSRLIAQELPGLGTTLKLHKKHGTYCVVFENPAAWVRLYSATASDATLPCDNPLSDVGEYSWEAPHDALGLWLRRGAREMIEDFIAGRNEIVRLWCTPASAHPEMLLKMETAEE